MKNKQNEKPPETMKFRCNRCGEVEVPLQQHYHTSSGLRLPEERCPTCTRPIWEAISWKETDGTRKYGKPWPQTTATAYRIVNTFMGAVIGPKIKRGRPLGPDTTNLVVTPPPEKDAELWAARLVADRMRDCINAKYAITDEEHAAYLDARNKAPGWNRPELVEWLLEHRREKQQQQTETPAPKPAEPAAVVAPRRDEVAIARSAAARKAWATRRAMKAAPAGAN